MAESHLAGLLQERARRQPDDVAYTFIDYEIDPGGSAESLTWSQLHNRAQVVAEELSLFGAVGDRAAIVAPQGLEYIVAFYGALQAGFIAAPLSVPQFGVHDERISSVLRDCSPSVILTTTGVAGEVERYARADWANRSPVLIEVDSLDLDAPARFDAPQRKHSKTAYLQYTSGSTRVPAGVVVTHENVVVNLVQALTDYFNSPELTPPGMTFVSWLPFYHDMGLIKGVFGPLVSGRSAVLMSPMAFLQKPARWIQQLAINPKTFSAAPNFAFELAVRRTTDDDMAGLDLGGVLGIGSGSERVHAATVHRFLERFRRFNLPDAAVKPSYGLAEATVYVATSDHGAPNIVRFDYEKLSSGHAMPCESEAAGGADLLGHGTTRSTTLRIVDPDTGIENPADKVGEIWVHGKNVANGYWQRPEDTKRVFGATLVNASAGTPRGPWLRTGDLGVISDGELFIIGRIKDLLIVDGSNHYPDDIEATVQEISNGRVAAISVSGDRTEQLVTIVEVKKRGTDKEHAERLKTLKRQITSAISTTHRLRLADLVFVASGSIPITTSGKIRRSSCAELYGSGAFDRLDAAL